MTLGITKADREKWLMRIGMGWVRKKFAEGKNAKQISELMEDCGNPVIKFLHSILHKTIANINTKDRHQERALEEFGDFGLWVMYEDTAYRQPFIWALKQILDKKKELMPFVMKYYVEPKDWYVNRWARSKEITKEKREKGELDSFTLSDAEKYYVPAITNERNNAIYKQKIMEYVSEMEKEKKKKGIK
jgi:hypothetical protein